MSKVWGNIGAWAAEAERAEAEEKEQAAAAAAAAPPQSYPSLKEAANTNKGKKKTKMTLQEFTMAGPGGLASRRDSAIEYNRLTPQEMMRLPTGPKERSAEEMQHGRLGGGFSSYGGARSGAGPRMRDRDGESDGNWGRRSYGGFDDDRRGPPPRISEHDQPSRADEVDNWAMAKKPMMRSSDAGSRPNRYSSLGGSGGAGGAGGGFSRADEMDNWAMNKKSLPPPRSSNLGSGLRESGGPEQDRWARGVVLRGGDQERTTERRRLVLDPPRTENAQIEPVVRTNKPNPFGAARPREEILAEKGLDWKKVDLEIEAKKSSSSSRPTSSHSNSMPESAHSDRSTEGPAMSQILEKPRAKVNPFGDAKPREVLLQEKGVDYRKIDLDMENRHSIRPEAEEEKILKEEIDNLKRDLERVSVSDANKESQQGTNVNKTNLRDKILQKESELEQLNRDLDKKVNFLSQKTVERPGSGAGRIGSSFQERAHSQSGLIDESRSVDFSERPWSRGTKDSWMKSGDARRGFAGGRDGGFLGNRDSGRSNSRERW